MKRFSVLLSALAVSSLLVLSGCKEEGCMNADAINYNADAGKDDGSCIYKGRVTFWNDDAADLCNVDVFLDGVPIGTVTLDYVDNPGCSAAGTVTIELEPGTYNYTALEEDCDGDGEYETWEGSVTVMSQGCLQQELY